MFETTLQEIFLTRQNCKMPNDFFWLFLLFWTQQLLPFPVFSQNCSPRKISTVWRTKKNPLALFFNGREPFMASEKQNKLFSGDNKSCKHLKTSQFLNEFFKRFYAQITADFLIEAAHLPLRSAYGLWVLLKIFFGKLLKIAACGFSQTFFAK